MQGKVEVICMQQVITLLCNESAISILIGKKNTAYSGWHSIITSYLQAFNFIHVVMTAESCVTARFTVNSLQAGHP